MGACEGNCVCASTIFIWGFVCKIGYIDCVPAEGLAWILSPLYSTHSVKGSDYAGHPIESLARESVYSWAVTRCKSRVKARIYAASHKPQYCWWAPWVLLLLAASLTHGHVLNFVSTVIYQLISDNYVSPVQFTSVQWLVTPASTCMYWQ